MIDSDPETVFCQEYFQELSSTEVKELVSRDTLRLTKESILFEALDRWAMFECRRNGVKPTASNKRAALSDDVWYSVRYLLMTDREFIEGPMASGIFFSEESAYIVARILGHTVKHEEEKVRSHFFALNWYISLDQTIYNCLGYISIHFHVITIFDQSGFGKRCFDFLKDRNKIIHI